MEFIKADKALDCFVAQIKEFTPYPEYPSQDENKAKKMIGAIVKDPEVGDVFYGKVVRLMGFGAFVQIAPGKDGLVHISKLEKHRVERVEDVVNVGDMIWVKVIEIDDKGRINLSRKDVKEEEKVL